MAYLHDKNIVHGALNSVNISLELKTKRVKISLIDHGEKLFKDNQVNLPALTYLSPELIKTIELSSRTDNCDNEPTARSDTQNFSINSTKLSKKSDIFSFGTLMFELFEERFPFGKDKRLNHSSPSFILPFNQTQLPANWQGNISQSASQIIYQIGAGLIGKRNLTDSQINLDTQHVQLLISACWAPKPTDRPQFKELRFA